LIVFAEAEMSAYQITIKSALLCLAALSLTSCAGGRSPGEHIADMPHWMGGLPPRCTAAPWYGRIRCMDGEARSGSGEAEERAAAA
jgi:hypothetical protein